MMKFGGVLSREKAVSCAKKSWKPGLCASFKSQGAKNKTATAIIAATPISRGRYSDTAFDKNSRRPFTTSTTNSTPNHVTARISGKTPMYLVFIRRPVLAPANTQYPSRWRVNPNQINRTDAITQNSKVASARAILENVTENSAVARTAAAIKPTALPNSREPTTYSASVDNVP